MANVDLKTGVIKGAVKGTKTYRHEQGHLKFEDEYKFGNFIRVCQELSLKFLLFAVAFQLLYPNIFFKIFIIIFMLISIYSEIIEEAWCWAYANNKQLNGEKVYGDKFDKISK
jgi:hypothetical protein